MYWMKNRMVSTVAPSSASGSITSSARRKPWWGPTYSVLASSGRPVSATLRQFWKTLFGALVLDLREPASRVIAEQMLHHARADQPVAKVPIRLALDVEKHHMGQEPRNFSGIDLRPGRQTSIEDLRPPVCVAEIYDARFDLHWAFI